MYRKPGYCVQENLIGEQYINDLYAIPNLYFDTLKPVVSNRTSSLPVTETLIGLIRPVLLTHNSSLQLVQVIYYNCQIATL